MITIGVVTVGRSDYGILRPVMEAIRATPGLRLRVYVAGMHLEKKFGLTAREIEKDGYDIYARVAMGMTSDAPGGIAKSMSLGVRGFGDTFAKSRPDLLMLMGDRFDMFTAGIAALPFVIPLVHLHGGEATEGLIDDAIRHSLSKMSHLHFVSTSTYRDRLIQMGEEPWRIAISGAPSLDNLRTMQVPDAMEIERLLGMTLAPAPMLVTFHPVTLEYTRTERHVGELMAALDRARMPVVFTAPNADTRGEVVERAIRRYVASHGDAHFVKNCGTRVYFGLMKCASVMVGNSSSGIIEAASVGLPVVNVGNRQKGRVHGPNVIDVACERGEILAGIRKVCRPAFRSTVDGLVNPYGDGHAARRIVNGIQRLKADPRLLKKHFHVVRLAKGR